MAKNGSFNTSGYGSRYLIFSWEEISQNVEENSTTISWALKGAGGSETDWYMAKAFEVVVDGEKVWENSGKIELHHQIVASGTKKLHHANDGSRSFAASVSAQIYTYGVPNATGSGRWDLDGIIRGVSLISVPNFTDEQDLTITYSNPAGELVDTLEAGIGWGGPYPVAFRPISKTAGTYTFRFTEEERNLMREYCSDAKSKSINVKIRMSMGAFSDASVRTPAFSVVNADPEISPEVWDTYSPSATLTGDSKVLVRDYSGADYKMNPTLKKGASIKQAYCRLGNSVLYGISNHFSDPSTNEFIFVLEDSRGNIAQAKVVPKMIPYVRPSVSLDAFFGFAQETRINVFLMLHGSYYHGSFGASENFLDNGYRFREEGGTWSEWIYEDFFTESFSDGQYTAQIRVQNLDYAKAYEFEVTIKDRLDGNKNAKLKFRAQPICEWGSGDFRFNVPVDFNGQTIYMNRGTIYGADIYIYGNKISDFVVEEGESGIWRYRKWRSGRKECWGKKYFAGIAVDKQWGALYTSGSISDTYPFEFGSDPVEYANVFAGGAQLILSRVTANTVKSTAAYQMVRPTQTGGINGFITYYACGI